MMKLTFLSQKDILELTSLEKKYKLYDSVCPYKFEIPIYSFIDQDKHLGAEPCWQNVNYPKFNA